MPQALVLEEHSLILAEMDSKAYRPPPAADGGPHFYFDGHVLTRRQFEYFLINTHEPVIVAGSASEEQNLGHISSIRAMRSKRGASARFMVPMPSADGRKNSSASVPLSEL